ncbi:DNA ligase 4 [Cylindrobasidium torrendii FP15055 ss-10]|uniref:DNA ligase n=1 Tax=Cylindrobasidium torrendii FP15055 ss-10 TaxID=1314674 RepID=A0A0D7BAX2_9AGAR|nr:DNA ligase 4 [Cylindrobasidium torrendii FP15055 ss-10]
MQATPAPSSPPRSPSPSNATVSKVLPNPPPNTGTAPFSILTGLFEKLQNERKRDKKEKLINAWFTHWREQKGMDLYPVLRLILPFKDRERAVYGLKEQNLAKTYIKLIPLNPKDPDAMRLTHWKKPTEKDKVSGDFPTVLHEVISKRSSVVESSLTIAEVNDMLDELASHMGSREVQSRILKRVYNRATPDDQRWLARIILKDLVISVKETTVLAVFHPDAQDMYNTCSDLKKVAWGLWDPNFRMHSDNKAVRLFQAFTPMLCSRPTRKIEETVKEMGEKDFFIEEKLDGERMQLHKSGNEYFYCSRKGKEYTYLYGKHVGEGSLTPYIDKAFDERVDSIILDGEMLVWDPISQRNLPFGTLKTAAGDKTKKANMPRPCFKVFDIVYLNGSSLIDRSTSFRKKNMRHCLKEIPGRIEFTIEYKGRTAEDIRAKMDEIMENRGEGLVIKHPSSKYVLNGRNKDWIKVKPEYMDNMGETVDVLVVGGNYGTGGRGGAVSTLVCAVAETGNGDDDDLDMKYRTYVRIGSGLTYADYLWIRSLPWKKWDDKKPPSFLKLSPKHSREDKGDLYLEPEDSFILKVKAAEVTKSDGYHMGFTMRFPRAMSIRTDLTIADCMTDQGVMESVKNVAKRKLESDFTTKSNKKKTKPKAKPKMTMEYTGPKVEDIEVSSDVFEDMKFVVIPNAKSKDGDQEKKAMQSKIIANGGKYQQIVGKNPQGVMVVFMGSGMPYDVKMIIKKGATDIITPDWIEDSIALGRPAPLNRRYFVYATEDRQLTAEYRMDQTDDGEDEESGDEDDESQAAGPSRTKARSPSAMSDEPKRETKEDPELEEWLNVPKDDTRHDSATDDEDYGADSDNDGPDMDDFVKVAMSQPGYDSDTDDGEDMDFISKDDLKEENMEDEVQPEKEDVKMGENDEAMEYDTELIFRHLCFYLDSPKNARKLNMKVKDKHETAINNAFDETAEFITANGGRIVEMNDPKLTHILLDKRDTTRRLDLIKLTSKPKLRQLVIREYIQACLDENTLLDEDDFKP